MQRKRSIQKFSLGLCWTIVQCHKCKMNGFNGQELRRELKTALLRDLEKTKGLEMQFNYDIWGSISRLKMLTLVRVPIFLILELFRCVIVKDGRNLLISLLVHLRPLRNLIKISFTSSKTQHSKCRILWVPMRWRIILKVMRSLNLVSNFEFSRILPILWILKVTMLLKMLGRFPRLFWAGRALRIWSTDILWLQFIQICDFCILFCIIHIHSCLYVII